MTYQIIRLEDNEYCPLLMCEKCKEHTRHAKGEKVAWTLINTKNGDLISTEFNLAGDRVAGEAVAFRVAWECGECGTDRVWGV